MASTSAPCPRRGERPLEARRLHRCDLSHERLTGRCREQLALPSVGVAEAALDVAALDQILEHAVEALLGDLQNIEEFRDGQARAPRCEIEHPMMGATEPIPGEQTVGIGDKVTIGEEHQFDEVEARVGPIAVSIRVGPSHSFGSAQLGQHY